VRVGDGTWAVNLHATTRNEPRALAECEAAARAWAGVTPLVFGGDLNLPRAPALPGLRYLGGNHVDHLYAAGLEPAGRVEVLDRGRLSDHAPLAVSLAARSRAG
jgi:endonuclease/exonuclease/phosphatase (EEP) superfamily protein YafD